MNKRIKKKYTKELFKFYKGQMIWKNHAYCAGHRPRTKNVYFGPRVMLCYNHTGNEIYFDNIPEAVRHIDRYENKFKAHKLKFEKELDYDEKDCCAFDITPDQIPFETGW